MLPASEKISKEAKDAVQECVSEFISFVTSEASDRCQQEKRKTINGDDLLFALENLGFDEYKEPLRIYLQKYRAAAKGGDKDGAEPAQGAQAEAAWQPASSARGPGLAVPSLSVPSIPGMSASYAVPFAGAGGHSRTTLSVPALPGSDPSSVVSVAETPAADFAVQGQGQKSLGKRPHDSLEVQTVSDPRPS